MAEPRRIVYLSGTRADFGLMRACLERIAAHPGLDLRLAVTGMHLLPEFGHTLQDIEASGLRVAARIPSDVGARDGAGMARAVAQTLLGMTAELQREPCDALLLLGDRGEMLAGATAALHLGIPVVHLHGGERSGTVDEPMRHAVSKLATYHFAATAESRERLLAMGEQPGSVFVVGAPGLDDIARHRLAPREQTLRALGIEPAREFVLVVFHPVVQQAAQAAGQTRELLAGLRDAGAGRDFDVLWLAPNADAGSAQIESALQACGAGWHRLTHLPRSRYLDALGHARALAGNSSSGIIEAASFGTPVLDVGRRQHLRERNAGVLHVEPRSGEITAALQGLLGSPRPSAHNVYGDGHAGERIARLLADIDLHPGLLNKTLAY
ncbi:MAG: UDP-N-acetylglucosamine 2-epimerase (hydrolyzing) [Betaproteobacteria bacterium]|nr:UDP-N-acetylglucosamine 2-epimerase (hydrolyzing) [Betaproteobacteria bacterium]MBU6512351.1 UDP-N-acetylglucosamine 2-epimerase (hydrolyzing) [Betaproteobacteria bacterium]MDE1954471.1 UDP-N-acetylglucosamine 2-epimerase (hydrolyzing) [Betaproteobacteria bacterium]MDE2152590.1 UDP-N-acetylglucosamine 2-epimerase (hydrolyzing) [Betaproteobacteria bacterium]MDE2479662.1 UDP-N-acetylglucosamine 2-epimerase (hydrolyzing) [Betaproteobacteria bacterium]